MKIWTAESAISYLGTPNKFLIVILVRFKDLDSNRSGGGRCGKEFIRFLSWGNLQYQHIRKERRHEDKNSTIPNLQDLEGSNTS